MLKLKYSYVVYTKMRRSNTHRTISLLLVLTLVLFTIPVPRIVHADGDISSCGTISSSGTYTLTQDFGAGGACIYIEASGVIIEGAGHTINGEINSVRSGTPGSDAYSFTIQNLTVTGDIYAYGTDGSNGSTSGESGQNGGNGGNITVTNSTINGSITAYGGNAGNGFAGGNGGNGSNANGSDGTTGANGTNGTNGNDGGSPGNGQDGTAGSDGTVGSNGGTAGNGENGVNGGNGGVGGNGGNVTLTNSTVTGSISAGGGTGGNGAAGGDAGNGGTATGGNGGAGGAGGQGGNGGNSTDYANNGGAGGNGGTGGNGGVGGNGGNGGNSGSGGNGGNGGSISVINSSVGGAGNGGGGGGFASNVIGSAGSGSGASAGTGGAAGSGGNGGTGGSGACDQQEIPNCSSSGANGVAGAAGSAGNNGIVGTDGSNGSTGSYGSNGSTGSSGLLTYAPNVSLTSPSASSQHSGTVSLTATATDNDDAVEGVKFYISSPLTLLGSEDTSSPYTGSFNSALFSDGSYTLVAVARDTAGNYATSTSVSITIDNTAPTPTFTTPTNGSYASSTVTLAATATDNNSVSGVQFKVGNTNIGSEDTSSPYTVSWDSTGVADGSKTLNAVVRDVAGNYATSSITVTVDNTAPVISAVSSGSLTTSGATITWTTDTTADSLVEYGLTSSYTASSTYSASLVTSHSTTLSGLSANTTYHYRVISVDAAGNRTNGSDNTFTTSAETVTNTTPSGGGGSGSRGYTAPTVTPVLIPRDTCLPGHLYNTLTGEKCIVTPIPTTTIFTKDLYLGLVDPEVKLLQVFLNTHDYTVSKTGNGSPGREINRFGLGTRSALQAFQRDNGIRPVNGRLGPVTRSLVNNLLKAGL